MLGRLFVAVFIAILLASCANERRQSTVESISGIDQFDAAQYYDDWEGDLTLPGFDEFVGLSDQKVTREVWVQLVEKLRREGVSKLRRDEWSILARGSVKSYLLRVTATERKISVDSNTSSTVVETYQRDETGAFVLIASREERSTEMSSSWGDIVTLQSGEHHSLTFLEYSDNAGRVSEYVETDQSWTCRSNDADFVLGFTRGTYLSRLAAILVSDVLRSDTYAGRDVVVVSYPRTQGGSEIWLDRHSLFPVRFVLSEVRGVDGSTIQPAVDVAIASLNAHQPAARPMSCGSAQR